MAGDEHGATPQEEPQAAQDVGDGQAQEGEPQMSGAEWEAAIAERDARIASLEQQVADAAKSAEAAEALRAQIAELKEQGESDRIDFALKLAGVRSVKAARAVLADHDNDIEQLKQDEPWLFGAPAGAGGKTGLANAGAASDEGRDLKRWRGIAGLG